MSKAKLNIVPTYPNPVREYSIYIRVEDGRTYFKVMGLENETFNSKEIMLDMVEYLTWMRMQEMNSGPASVA